MRTALCILSEEKDIAEAHELLALLDADFFSEVFFLAKINETNGNHSLLPDRVHFIDSDIRYSDEDFWAKIIACVPREIDQALVIPNIAFCTRRLLNLRVLLSDSVAAVFPLSTSHPASRAFLEPPKNIRLNPEQIEHWLNRFAVAQPLEIPVFAGSAGWMNLKTLKKFAGGNDFEIAEIARQSGHSLLVSDEAYVDDSACGPRDLLPASLPSAITDALMTRHPYTSSRHPITQLNERMELPPKELSATPKIILHISHSWGGGLARWISGYAQADSNNLHLILKSVGDLDAPGKFLWLFGSNNENVPLRTWTLTTPIVSTSTGSYEYSKILNTIIAEHSISSIFVSTLIGHSLDVYQSGLPTLHVLHDFYPWCPPLYATWETSCESCDPQRLVNCLGSNPAHGFFPDQPSTNFLSLRASFISAVAHLNIPLVAPSQSVKNRWVQLADNIDPSRISVIPHGLSLELLRKFESGRWHAGEGLKKLIVLGRLATAKGEDILEAALPVLLKQYEVILLGCGNTHLGQQKHANLNVIEDYDADSLPQILGELQPDCGLLLSTVPETFSFTLSELNAAGVPTVATRLGAFTDRIEDGVNGWLIEPSATKLLAQIEYLKQNPHCLRKARLAISASAQITADDMVAAYADLLQDGCAHRVSAAMRHMNTLESDPSNRVLGANIFGGDERPYFQVLSSFLAYTENKLLHSPRLPSWLKYGGCQILRVVQQLLRKG